MLVSRVIANQKDCRCVVYIAHAGGRARFSAKRRNVRRVIHCTMVIDVVRPEYNPRKFLQQIILFVRGARRTDYANCLAAIALKNPLVSLANVLKSRLPGCGS